MESGHTGRAVVMVGGICEEHVLSASDEHHGLGGPYTSIECSRSLCGPTGVSPVT